MEARTGEGKLKKYELLCVLQPEVGEEGAAKMAEHIKGLVSRYEGEVEGVEHWGTRELSYPIKKKGSGYYLVLTYAGSGRTVSEVERALRIDDRVLRVMTVRRDEPRKGKRKGAGGATPPAGRPPHREASEEAGA